jgi:hypothetical protein
MSTVIVTGGRDLKDFDLVSKALDRLHSMHGGISLLVHGGAQGADSLAGQWAKDHGVEVKVYEADWGRHGRGAGPLRNIEMLEAHRFAQVLGFPGGRGTKHCLETAVRFGMRVQTVRRLGPSLFWERKEPSAVIRAQLHNRQEGD